MLVLAAALPLLFHIGPAYKEPVKKYFPSLAKLSQETIATGFAVIVIAFIVSKSPTLRALVRNYDLSDSTTTP